MTQQLTRAENAAQMAKDAFRNHTITSRLDQGPWKSWRCQRPNSWTYGFDVTTGPGWLLIHGDIGSVYFERETDMISWAQKAQDDIHYLAQKTDGGPMARQEFDGELAKQELSKLLKEARESGDREQAKNIVNAMRDADLSDESGLYSALQDNDLDVYDIPTCQNWRYSFLWQVEALRWFLAKLAEQSSGKEVSGSVRDSGPGEVVHPDQSQPAKA